MRNLFIAPFTLAALSSPAVAQPAVGEAEMRRVPAVQFSFPTTITSTEDGGQHLLAYQGPRFGRGSPVPGHASEANTAARTFCQGLGYSSGNAIETLSDARQPFTQHSDRSVNRNYVIKSLICYGFAWRQ